MGDLVLKKASSGQITLTPENALGDQTLTLPAKTGNIITSADSGTVTGSMLASTTVGPSNLTTGAPVWDSSSNLSVGTTTANGSKVSVKNTPTSQWGVDFSESEVTVANGSNVELSVGSGMILITDPTSTGDTGLYIMGGGSSVLVNTTSATFVTPTATPAAGKACVFRPGSGNYRIYNNIGVSVTFKLAMFRTRNSN